MNLKEIQKEIQNIKLTPEEKSGLFERVINTTIPSPYAPKPSPWKFLHKPLALAILSLLVLVGSGGGVSYASLKTLPGDILYKVKVEIAEPIVDALIFSPKAQAEQEATKAIRRLDEAWKLAQENKLTTKNRIEIEEHFNKSVSNFSAEIKKVKDASKNDPTVDTDDLNKNFENSLDIQVNLLKKTYENNKEAKNKQQEEEISILENTVREKISFIKTVELKDKKD